MTEHQATQLIEAKLEAVKAVLLECQILAEEHDIPLQYDLDDYKHQAWDSSSAYC